MSQTYPLDTTGVNPDNKVVGEEHTITLINDRSFNFIVPTFGPFFATGFKIWKEDGANLLPLVQGVDWQYAFQYTGPSLAWGKPVYGGISFIDTLFEGKVIIDYQNVGGDQVLDLPAITEVIANIKLNPRVATWEQVTGKPQIFPPNDHPWDFDHLKGTEALSEGLLLISEAITNKAVTSIDAHLMDMDNPHETSKTQVGLGLVSNFPPASAQQAIEGTSADTLLTPATLHATLVDLGILQFSADFKTFQEHIHKEGNVHNMNKSHIGLGLVENLAVATTADILARKKVRKYVTMEGLIDFINLYGCQPIDNPEIDYPPKGALLSEYCQDLKRMGVYATGMNGTYEEIIELDAVRCGYVAPRPIQHPPFGTILQTYCIGLDEFALIADGYGGSGQRIFKLNSQTCGATGPSPGTNPAEGTLLGSRCDGTTLVKTVANGTGGSREERENASPSCPGGTTGHPAAGTLLRTQCQGVNQMAIRANGSGGEYAEVMTVNSPDCGYRAPNPPPPPPTQPPYVPPPPQPPEPPPTPKLAIHMTSMGAAVVPIGSCIKSRTTWSGVVPGRSYTIQFFHRQSSSGTWYPYYSPTVRTPTATSETMDLPLCNDGDFPYKMFSFWAQITDNASGESARYDMSAGYTVNRSLSLKINSSSSSVTGNHQNQWNVQVQFTDFATPGAINGGNVSFKMMMSGATNNSGAPMNVKMNSVGAYTANFQSTLAGAGTSQVWVVATFTDFNGNTVTTESNKVTMVLS